MAHRPHFNYEQNAMEQMLRAKNFQKMRDEDDIMQIYALAN